MNAISDLLWVMRSPSLVSQSLNHEFHPSVSDEWCASKLREAIASGRIDALRRNPEPLIAHLEARRSKTRLGIYFESLIEFWLRYLIPGVKDVRTEIQVHENQRTIGAYDFLFYDEREARLKHWEVAIKYYLYVAGQSGGAGAQASDATGFRCNRENYYGPQTLDRLHLKLDQMLNQQMPLGLRLGAQSEMMVKGILFYPYDSLERWITPPEVSSRHTRGTWLHAGEFASRDWSAFEIFELGRLDWMNALSPGPELQPKDIRFTVETTGESTQLLVRAKRNPKKSTRLFVVKDGWPYLSVATDRV